MAKNRKSYIPLLLLGIVLVGGFIIYTFFDPVRYAWMPKCPFHLLTGWNCPVCGMQRAIYALLHGRFAESLAYNYFFVVCIPYLIALLVAEIMKQLHSGACFVRVIGHPFVTTMFLILAVLWGVIRNLLGV